MSWLNFNESLNSIKGQLSSFASGVLADGIVGETENDRDLVTTKSKIEELEERGNTHDVQVEKASRVNENVDRWSWEPSGEPHGEPPSSVGYALVSDLQKKIDILESEKKELVVSLEQLDVDCQQTTDKLVTLKDNLQTSYNELKYDFEKLQEEYGKVLEENMEKSKSIENSRKGENLEKTVGELREKNRLLKDRLIVSQREMENREKHQKDYENCKHFLKEERRKNQQLNNLAKTLEDENVQLRLRIRESEEKDPALKSMKAGENENLSLELQNIKRENEELRDASEKLQQILKNEQEKLKIAVAELRIRNDELKNNEENWKAESEKFENENLKLANKCENLKIAREKLANVYGKLKNVTEESKKEYEQTKNDHQTLIEDYKNVKKEFERMKEDFKRLKNELRASQNSYGILNEKCQRLKDENEKLTNDASSKTSSNQDLLFNCKNLKSDHERLASEKEALHEKYLGIISESMEKYIDSDTDATWKISRTLPDDQPQIVEFAGKVEALIKLLSDFKCKTETLEKELCGVTQEKSKAICEKNFEIEKLLKNSEILSREVITKSQAIKDYEDECGELMKNNDLLISELQNYKNGIGLQTISEGNEDNLLLLESQLENANKRIQDLELIISDLENSKQEVNVEMQTELEYIKKQLNMTGQELNHSKEESQRLLMRYKNSEDEKRTLKGALDKVKLDYENIEYKYTEVNVSVETLKEENEEFKQKIIDSDSSGRKLEALNFALENKIELFQNVVDDYKQKLAAEAEKTNEKELQIRTLVERLQNSKMCETGLKLQVDTIYKELQTVTEAKQSLELKYNRARANWQEAQDDLVKIEEERRDKLIVDRKDFPSDENAKNDGGSEESTRENLKIHELRTQLENAHREREIVQTECAKLKNNITQVIQQNGEYQQKILFLEGQFADLSKSRNELIALVTAKHQENIQYHGEIQRLNRFLADETEKACLLEVQLQNNIRDETRFVNPNLPPEEVSPTAQELSQKNQTIEKLTDQNNFLREKCEVLAQNLLQEQSNVQKALSERSSTSDKEQSSAKELERLRAHLVEIEEMYTQELIQAEEKNNDMQAKVNEIAQREKNSSSIYTSVSIRANQQVETLQTQLQLVTIQRDELRLKISDLEDDHNKQVAALTNLQLVLEQFQKEREKDVYQETERVRRQINVERQIQQELRADIVSLKFQLEESKQGLQAACRLSDQLEKSKQQVVNLKDEVTKLHAQLKTGETKYKELSTQTDLKVDKTLIKNLVIGYINSHSSDQNQILKVIATVLDFDKNESDKVNLNKPQQGGWLSSILHPQSLNSSRDMTQQSLSEAFVRFLEKESKPKVLPNLLITNQAKKAEGSGSSSNTTPRQSPSPRVLSEVVLPTFVDFGKSRNSSSILKDVLKDNS